MRRAVILATLTLLLLTVAGVTAAQETPFTNPLVGDRVEYTAPVETILSESTVVQPDHAGKPGGPRDAKFPKPALANKPGHPEAGRPESKAPAPGIGKARGFGKHRAAGARKPDNARRRGNRVEPNEQEKRGPGRPGRAGGSHFINHREPGGGREKVPLCHKDRVTITVGAPARAAHLRHGDSVGVCG